MSLDQEILAQLPPRSKRSPSGWISFNAPCCQHRGHSQDRRRRGGVMADAGTVSYHCFNCGFKCSWAPGRLLSDRMRQWLSWLGVSDSDIQKMAMQALRGLDQNTDTVKEPELKFEARPLPEGSVLLRDQAEHDPESVLHVLEYLGQRQFYLDDYPWYWSSNVMYKNRIIIPIFLDGEIVGSTARAVNSELRPRYLSSHPPGLVFNLDRQLDNRSFVIVVEGIFDAIAIDGVAVMGGQINSQQQRQIQQLGREVIVVPDRDHVGREMIDSIQDWGWAVSMPPWPEGIKDVADACEKLGRLTALAMIVAHSQTSQLKINLTARHWFENSKDTE